MKNICILMLCLLGTVVLAQPPGNPRSEIKTIVRGSADTNKVISDENGKELRYHQYMPLVRSGQYKLRYNGDPSLPETKGQLIRMTPEDKVRTENIRMYGLTPPNDGILKVNSALDVLPLSMVLQKDLFTKKPLLLMFWSPDIPSSMSAVAYLSVQLKGYNSDSLVVLLITTADKARAEILSNVASKINARLVSNAADIFDNYQVTAMPFYIVTDQNRIIRHNATGTGPAIAESTMKALDDVLGIPIGSRSRPNGTLIPVRQP